jgi:heat shock protein HslJ
MESLHIMMKKKYHLTPIVVIPLILLLGGCAIADQLPTGSNLAGSGWRLVSYLDSTGNLRPAAPGSQVTLEFTVDLVSGSAGCNSFSGNYQVKGQSLRFGALASTLMACEENLMQQEIEFFNLLSQTTRYESGAELRLFGSDERLLAIFAPLQTPAAVPQPTAGDQIDRDEVSMAAPSRTGQPSELVGADWKWIEYQADNGLRLSPPDPEKYTLYFYPDGKIKVHADCNIGTGAYLLQGKTLNLRVAILTLATCGEGSLSAQFIGYLNQASSFSFDGMTLVIHLDAGVLKLVN